MESSANGVHAPRVLQAPQDGGEGEGNLSKTPAQGVPARGRDSTLVRAHRVAHAPSHTPRTGKNARQDVIKGTHDSTLTTFPPSFAVTVIRKAAIPRCDRSHIGPFTTFLLIFDRACWFLCTASRRSASSDGFPVERGRSQAHAAADASKQTEQHLHNTEHLVGIEGTLRAPWCAAKASATWCLISGSSAAMAQHSLQRCVTMLRGRRGALRRRLQSIVGSIQNSKGSR